MTHTKGEQPMYYVYLEHIRTGRCELAKVCENEADAIRHIAKCYRIDTELGQLGEYYYCYKKR